MAGYSYTTIAVHPGQQPSIGVHLTPDDQAAIYAPRPGGDRAQVSITFAEVTVFITPENAEAPTAEDVRVARRLSETFVAYLAEVERLHSQNAEDNQADPPQAPAA